MIRVFLTICANFVIGICESKLVNSMIRKLRLYAKPTIAAVACMFFVLSIKYTQVGRSGIVEDEEIEDGDNLETQQLLAVVRETESFFFELTHVVQVGKAGIDPRTNDLNNLTAKAFSDDWFHSRCHLKEMAFEKLIRSSHGTVKQQRYVSEVLVDRVYIEISFPDFEENSTAQNNGLDKVTMITQLTCDRVYMLDFIVERWQGPAVIVIYASSMTIQHKQLSKWLRDRQRHDVKILVVQKDGLLFPVNWLRNLGLVKAKSKHVFVVDGDFVASKDLHLTLGQYMRELEEVGRRDVAVLVPAFEMIKAHAKVPKTREQLLIAYAYGEVDGFHMGPFPVAHSMTNFDKWRKTNSSYFIPQPQPCNDHFEPYLVLPRQQSPWFPETLLERRKNKIAYQYELCSRGFRFLVIHNGFIIHKDHPESMRAGSKTEKCATIAFEVFKKYVEKPPVS